MTVEVYTVVLFKKLIFGSTDVYFYFYRKSMEMRDSRNQESADWLKKYQMRSQAMKKTVTLHAKLLDPHSSLKEVNNEKLKLHM